MKKRDIFLILLVLCIAGLFYFIPKAMGSFQDDKDLKLLITIDGEKVGEYSLHENQEIPIQDTNVCEIKDNKVNMIKAHCPDQLCLRQGPIDTPGQTIVCLPNKVVLEIIGVDYE